MDLDDLLRRSFGRRDFIRLAAVGSAGFLAACRRERAAVVVAPEERPPIEEEPAVLHVLEWAGYDIAPLFRPYLKEGFEEPKFTYMTSDDHAVSKIRGGFRADVVHPCVDYTKDWVNLGLVQPWDTSLLSNWPGVNKAMAAQGQVDGKQYHVPVDWGFSAPLYRSDKVEPLEDSWTIFYDERYAGKISWWDDAVNLVINGMVKGFADPFNMTDEELEDVKADLSEKKKVVRNLWQSQTDMENDFAAGNIWITYAWPGTVVGMQRQGLQVVYMDPKETRLSWICGFALLADAEAYYHAHEFVDAWLAPRSAVWMLNQYGYGHSNLAIDLGKVDTSIVEAFSLADPSVLETRTTFAGWLPRRDVYNRVWDEVKAA